jgi:hypothetical protein
MVENTTIPHVFIYTAGLFGLNISFVNLWTYLFLYLLFTLHFCFMYNEVSGNCDCIVSSDGMISEKWVGMGSHGLIEGTFQAFAYRSWGNP